MDVQTAIRSRRSIRHFLDRQIPAETLRDIIEDAQWTPSWANSQPWAIYLATGDTLRAIKEVHLFASTQGARGQAEISTKHRADWSTAARGNMARWSRQLQGHLGSEHGAEYGTAQQDLFNAAAIAYVTIPRGASPWSILDLGAFTQTLMLSATGHGVQSMPAYETIKYPQFVRRHMDIPDSETLAIGIGLGYAAGDVEVNGFASERVPLDSILTIKA